jgi:all-trans-8'-apo-beta-carotenal 15,15'-oxygenase
MRRRFTRRELVRRSAILSAAGAVACAETTPLDLLPPPFYGPQLSVLRGTREEIDDEALTVVGGTLPTDMAGHAFIASPVPYGDGTPLFTGDAMVTRLSFTPSEARIKTRLLRTDDFLLDQASASSDATLAYVSHGMLRASPQLGARDFANTALVPVGNGRLIATYDAGRPWEIDPVTLDPITPVGLHSAYLPMIPPLSPGYALFPVNMTTAHPVWDADDALLYYVNYAPPLGGVSTPFTRVMRWDAAHEPTHTDVVDAATGELAVITQACHQMAATERFVLLSDGAFLVELEQVTGGDATRAQRPTTVLWIVPKSELTDGGTARAVRCEIPVESAHFVAARNDAGDRITVVLMHQGSYDASEWVRASDVELDSGMTVDPRLAGSPVPAADLTTQGRYVIDARTGAVLESTVLADERLWGAALWASDVRDAASPGAAYFATMGFDPRTLTTRIVDAYRDHPNRVVPIAELPTTVLPSQLVHVDQASMSIVEALALPEGWTVMSPTFVPRRGGAAGAGYVVAPVLGPDWDEIWVLRADDLAYGPVCRLRHAQYDVGFSLHTTWMAELVSSRATYRVDKATDYAAGLAEISAEAAALVRRTLGL